MRQTHLVLIVFAGLLLLCNCNSAPAQSNGDQTAALPDCLASGNCLIGNCSSEICKQAAQTLVHVEIEPSPRSGYVGQQHLNVPLGQLFGKGLELKPMVFFYGTLIRSKASSTGPITIRDNGDMSSDIIAIPISLEESNGKRSIILANQSVLTTTVDSRGFFTLNLVSGQEYRLITNPQGLGGLPPTFLDVQIDSDHVGDISLPSASRKVTGAIEQKSTFSNAELADKLWIRVVQGKRQISSLGRLSPDGHFSVTLANALFEKDVVAHPVQLFIEPASDVAYLSTIRKELILKDDGGDIDVGTLKLGPDSPLIRSTFTILSPENEPVKDARVFVRALTTNGYIQSGASTDPNGLAQIIIPEGQYDIAVIPQQDSVVGFKKINDAELRGSDAVEIRLEARATLKSSILDENGVPVNGARMVLTRFAKADSNLREAIFDSTELRLEAKSDSRGQWCIIGASTVTEDCLPIHLDSGRYRLSVTPPEGSKFPYYTQVFDFPEKSEMAIILKKAIPLKGKILAPKAEVPVANSFIRIYSSQIEKESGEPIFLTQAFSRIDGTFSVALPQEYVLGKTP